MRFKFLAAVATGLTALVFCSLASAQTRTPPKDPSEFMSADCLRLADAARQQSGNKAAQAEFDQRCSTELGLARQKAKEENAKNNSPYAQRRAKQRDEVEQTEEIQKQLRQCREMKAALDNRKARSKGSEGDKRDIEIFEQRFAERCPKG